MVDSFETKMDNELDITDFGEHDGWDLESSNFRVMWAAETEHRSWGIKEMYANLFSLYGSIYLEKDNGDYVEQKTILIDYLDHKEDAEWEVEINIDNTIPYYPSKLELDFAKKTIIIS